MTDQRMITVSLDDLALALYLPEPTTTPGHPSVARCVACGQPCGAHYCAPRERYGGAERMIVSLYEEEDELARKVPLDIAVEALRERLERAVTADERSVCVCIFIEDAS
jgi:hypothetical protein